MKITGYNFYHHLFEKIRKLLRKQNNLIIDMKMRFHLKKRWGKNVTVLYNYMSRIVRKPDFCLGENKGADQLRGNHEFAVTAKLISAFVFATRIVQFLFYLNPKFQASSSFLSLYRPVCVGPGRKPRRLVFSRRGT